MLSLTFFLLTLCSLVSCSRYRQKYRRGGSSSSSDPILSPLSPREHSSSVDSLYWSEDEEQQQRLQYEQCLKIPLSILAPYRGQIKQVAIQPGMLVEADQILYLILDPSVQGNVQKPLRSEYPGLIKTVWVSKPETIVQKGQILAEIVVLVCSYQQRQQQRYKQGRQSRKSTRANKENRRSRRSRRRTSESSQGVREYEREYRAWNR